MNLIEYFSQSEMNEVALILRCLLDRIPIIIKGNNESEIENFINELSALISFRNTIIFYTDFINEEDYQNLVENEESDLETQRNQFICYPLTLERAFQSFTFFKSWIFGVVVQQADNNLINEIHEKLYVKTNGFLTINIQNGSLKTEFEGKVFHHFNLSFEKWLFQNAIANTAIAIEKMKRVISKRINIKAIGKNMFDNLMNFSFEEKKLKENLIKKEISNFYDASRRAFNILSRMSQMQNFGYSTPISSKTLLSTIAYKQASMDRILSFILPEWGYNYNDFLISKKVNSFTDTFESLWG